MQDDKPYSEHYKSAPIEPIALMKIVLTPEELKGFYKGNIIKYSLRAGLKQGESKDKDITKMNAYLKLLENIEND